MLLSPERFSPETLDLVEDRSTELLLSAASSWEIAIKHALGRFILPAPPAEYVPSRMLATGVRGLAIEHRHALHVSTLPPHHRDPFDRLLVAQAQLEGVPILSVDRQLSAYDVEIVWADRSV
jgi:PIN domain nuclease of toxin-antitoxin system